jgi:hypothetical protein
MLQSSLQQGRKLHDFYTHRICKKNRFFISTAFVGGSWVYTVHFLWLFSVLVQFLYLKTYAAFRYQLLLTLVGVYILAEPGIGSYFQLRRDGKL